MARGGPPARPGAPLSAPLVMPPTPGPEPRPDRQIWSVGGGKGGIGKSLLTASLGWQLAQLGKRVVLLDADLGGANLHTCLGMQSPPRTLGDFIHRRVPQIEDVAVETGFPGMRLVSGASDFLSAANINYAQKVRLLNRIRQLNVDVVLIDLGAGTSYNIIDFFLISDVGLLTVVPEPTSVENGYRFIKSALYRKLRVATPEGPARELIEEALSQRDRAFRNPVELLTAVREVEPAAVDVLKRAMASFQPRFIINQVRTESDVPVGHQLVTTCMRHLGIRASYAGFVHYDDAVWQAVRHRRLFMIEAPRSRAAEEVRRLACGLLRGESLQLPW
jgi:flagellar biosynthesis protein FlhG